MVSYKRHLIHEVPAKLAPLAFTYTPHAPIRMVRGGR